MTLYPREPLGTDCRGRKVLENLSFQNDERIAALELSLQEAQMIAEDSDRKYDEVKDRNEEIEPDLATSHKWHLAPLFWSLERAQLHYVIEN